MRDANLDLYLKYQFTDQYGRSVYTMLKAMDENIIVGHISLTPNLDLDAVEIFTTWAKNND